MSHVWLLQWNMIKSTFRSLREPWGCLNERSMFSSCFAQWQVSISPNTATCVIRTSPLFPVKVSPRSSATPDMWRRTGEAPFPTLHNPTWERHHPRTDLKIISLRDYWKAVEPKDKKGLYENRIIKNHLKQGIWQCILNMIWDSKNSI